MYRAFDINKSVFEWDDEKERKNFQTHGIHFSTAAKAFMDPDKLIREDEEHKPEERYNILAKNGKVLFIVCAAKDDSIRLISARIATKTEKARYEKGESQD